VGVSDAVLSETIGAVAGRGGAGLANRRFARCWWRWPLIIARDCGEVWEGGQSAGVYGCAPCGEGRREHGVVDEGDTVGDGVVW
jgi:hypothetical protein